jgi:isopentenyl phosphate kinase
LRDLIILKLGGSVITYKKSKTPRANRKNIERISKEIASVYHTKKMPLIIVHGAGSYGHNKVKETGIDKGIKTDKQLIYFAETQWLQNKLNCIVTDYLIDEGIPAIPCQASSFAVMKSETLVKMDVSTIEGLVRIGMVPVLYGVPAYDEVQKCSILSGDEIAPYLAVKLNAKKIIHATIVDGVFTEDPNKNPNAKLIQEINSKNINQVKECLTGSTSTDVTGGMFRKVSELLDSGIESQIINGLTPENLIRALNGEKIGTMIKLNCK